MICYKCNESIPDISRYCLHCGTFLNTSEQEAEEEDIDWANRILCSDGNCVGTVVDGKCRICGTPGPGKTA